MPHFTLAITPAGPVLDAIIGVSKARADALTKLGQAIPSSVAIRALVDTGASSTCVDPGVLSSLQLSPTGSVPMHTPSTGATAHVASQYDISLSVPPANPSHPALYFAALPVICSELAVQGVQALIGRDILRNCVLVYNGASGFFTLAF